MNVGWQRLVGGADPTGPVAEVERRKPLEFARPIARALTPTAPGPQAYGIGTPGQALTAEESAAMVIINTQLNADKVARKEMPPFPPVPGFTDQQPATQPVPTVPTPGYPPTTRR